MILIARRKTLLVLGWFAVASLPAVAFGQGNVFNPYGNSGYPDYREFAVPIYSNDPTLPGQARLQSQPLGERPRRANEFEQYLNQGDALGGSATNPDAPRGTSPTGMPYYQSYRRFDRQYDRIYTPNNTKADKAFNERLKNRDAKFAEALKETDPAKRARMIRELQGATPDRPKAAKPARSSGAPKAKRPRTATTPAPGTAPTPPASSARVPYPPGYSQPGTRTAPRPTTEAPRPEAAPAPPPRIPAPADETPAPPPAL